MAQCLEFINSIPELQVAGIREQSFADFLIQNPPEPVRKKLQSWGVFDFRSIFSRAIGLNAVFCAPPDDVSVSAEFIRNYFRYADHLFACTERLEPFAVIHALNFQFDLYGSGEFSRILAEQWGE